LALADGELSPLPVQLALLYVEFRLLPGKAPLLRALLLGFHFGLTSLTRLALLLLP